MNWDQVEGRWHELKGNVKSRWAKLSDNDLRHMSAKKESLVGALQQRYGIMKEDAERQVDDWIAGLRAPDQDAPRAGTKRPYHH